MEKQLTATGVPRHSFFKYLLWSHISIAAIGAAALLLTLVTGVLLTRNMQALSRNTIPLFQASGYILRGVQHSLANMRGWVSLNDESFRADWYRIWETDINPAQEKLQKLGRATQIPGFAKQMQELNLLLAELKESQWWVFEIANTPGNEPARVLYRFETEPILHTLDSISRSLLDADPGQLRADLLSDNGNTIHNTVILYYQLKELLQKILFRGKISQEGRFRTTFAKLKDTIATLNRIDSKNQNFRLLSRSFQQELTALERSANKSIAVRKSRNWNVSRHLMATETVPLTKKISRLMAKLTDSLNALQAKQSALARSREKYIAIALFLLLGTMFTAAIFLSQRSAKKLAQPVILLADAARKMATGSLVTDIPTINDDELGDLTHSFNSMRKELHHNEQQLLRQEKLATIGQLSGSVAHDIRNPLGAISNSIYFLNLICDTNTDIRFREHITLMEVEIKRAIRIINDLLDFSRDNIPIFGTENINTLLQELVAASTLPENIVVEIQLDNTLPPIQCDRPQMERIFCNLILNAQQAMADGGTLSIRSNYSSISNIVQVEVSDTGCGIEKAKQKLIFEPLFTTKASGVGLGLSIVKDLVKNHHGHIDIESIADTGTTFRISLPVEQPIR